MVTIKKNHIYTNVEHMDISIDTLLNPIDQTIETASQFHHIRVRTLLLFFYLHLQRESKQTKIQRNKQTKKQTKPPLTCKRSHRNEMSLHDVAAWEAASKAASRVQINGTPRLFCSRGERARITNDYNIMCGDNHSL